MWRVLKEKDNRFRGVRDKVYVGIAAQLFSEKTANDVVDLP